MQHRAMAKKQNADLPLTEELLDKSIGLLEGPLNRVLEKAMKSRLLLYPMGLLQAVVWKSAGMFVPRSSSSSSPRSGSGGR